MNIPIDIVNKYRDLLSVAAISGKTVYENELTRISNLKVNRVQKITINYIFITYWHHFLKHFNDSLRPAIIKNVNALINCKDLSKGHLFLECSNCDNFHLLGLSCNSRFCTSCGQRYRSERSLNIQSKLLDSPHRHFVFSVPFNLRPIFWHCSYSFDLLEHLLSSNKELKEIYDLKHIYQDFNNYSNSETAEETLLDLIVRFRNHNIVEIREYGKTLNRWKKEIINSFTKYDGVRYSNGRLESTNRNIKTIIRNAFGVTNFERFRARVMYSINKNVSLNLRK